MPQLGEGVIDWGKDGIALTAEQKRFYGHNGYVIVRKCVPESEIDRYIERFNYLCTADRSEFPFMSVMRDITLAKTSDGKDVSKITKIQNWQDDPVLFDYCRYPTVVDVVKDLIGTPSSTLCAMHTMLINKPPDTGSLTSRHPLHQDLQYFPFRPADFICCAWTAMQRINRANGCLVVVPGSHKGPLHPHAYPNWEVKNQAYHGIQDYDPSMPRTYVEMEAGDTVFFHPLLIHGSGANRTDGFRRAISCHYANDDLCRYYEEKTKSQEETDKDVMRMLELKTKKLGIDINDIDVDYSFVWRIRSRAVNGEKCNL
ncbi:hypothetical protein PMAYCL1PPCAC_15374 [Pristionchus mayeri]|uniref:phytanoyl-CoA dioxygenase n=1 Tax=Pristionchus mayeri TaxID=1317129 RepID=A0AAN5HXZ4_9BILA|nr:hypothetical protein PMAYCL1PPCAC_15374 [Pristionchus mayeri]